MSIGQEEERMNQGGDRESVLIFCKQCSDSPPLPRQTHWRFPMQSQKKKKDLD